MARGTVESWNDEEGWGVLVSPEVDGGIWAHFSAIDADGYRRLEPGAVVDFEYIVVPGGQDGYDYRATEVATAES